MEFSFTDYTFSGLLSVLAALYGVGYPLIIQSIEKINAQYNSILLSERFTKEPVYILFQVLLILNMAFAITVPFLLHAGCNNKLFLTIQAALLVLIVGQTFLLFRLILQYSNSPELLKHIEGTQIDSKNIFHIFDLAVYADANHLYQLYLDCFKDVSLYIQAQQGDKFGQNNNDVLPPVNYDAVTMELTWKIKSYLRGDDGHHYLYRHNDIVSVFYNSSSCSRLSQQGRQIMWGMANEAIAYNNKVWFVQYWQFADNYANIKYNFINYDQKELNMDKDKFLDQHVMIGTALMHWKRWDWLNDIFFFTHSEPEYYGLIPSSFPHIIHVMRRLAGQCNNPLTGGWKYYFSDSMTGATDEKRIFRESIRYLSLLVIRLWSLKNHYLMNNTVLFSSPSLPRLLTVEEQEINLIEMMKYDVVEMVNKDIFQKIPNLTEVDKKEVLDFLDDYHAVCENDNKHRKEHPTVNKKKFDELYEQMKDEIEKLENNLANTNCYLNGISHTKEIRLSSKLETIHYSGFIQIDCRSNQTGICTNFWNNIAGNYIRFLFLQKKLERVRVPRRQIRNIIDAMGMNDSYAIISSAQIDELRAIDVVLNVLSIEKWFIVVKRDELPIANLRRVEDLMPVTADGAICSNIEDFINCNEPIFNLVLATNLCFSIPNRFSGYVLFTIEEDPRGQKVKIEPEKTFDELFLDQNV
jgi:hypothetical protein